MFQRPGSDIDAQITAYERGVREAINDDIRRYRYEMRAWWTGLLVVIITGFSLVALAIRQVRETIFVVAGPHAQSIRDPILQELRGHPK